MTDLNLTMMVVSPLTVDWRQQCCSPTSDATTFTKISKCDARLRRFIVASEELLRNNISMVLCEILPNIIDI